MDKNFDEWNEKKKIINSNEFRGYAHEREIWWCSLGINIGDEEDGKNDSFERPVLILKKFNRNIVLVVPLTTKIKDNKYYFLFIHENVKFAAILSQIRLISTKRFNRKVRKIDRFLFETIKNKIAEVSLDL